MAIPRMRTAEGILKELRNEDENMAISLHQIRKIIASGEIPVYSAGCRKLVDYDRFLAYLSNGGNTEPSTVQGIRQVN